MSGGTAIGTTVSAGGVQDVYSGGTADSTNVISGDQFVFSGVASVATLVSSSTEVVYGPSSAVSVTVQDGSEQFLNGGVAIDGFVSSGGTMKVYNGGVASGATVFASGSAVVSASGTTSYTTVSSGGSEYVLSGGTVEFTNVRDGGSEYVSSGGSAVDTLVDGGGFEYVSSSGTIGGATLNGGTLDVLGSVASGASIAFAVTTGTMLELGQTAQMSGSVTGFAAGDTLDLTGIAPASVSYTSGTLAIAGGQSFALSTTGAGETVQIGSNGSGGTALTLVSATTPALVTGGTVTYTGGGTAVALDSTATVTDGNPVTSAAVWINSGFVSGDQIHFTNQSGITGAYDAATGTLTLSGTTSAANWQTALDSITFGFSPADGDPTQAGNSPSRTIDWQVSDAGSSSAVTSSTVITQLSSILSYGATIDEGGIVAASETVDAGGTLTLFNSSGTAVGSIDVGTSLSTGFFTLTSDGAGGTDVIVDTVFGTYTSGITLLTNPTTIAATGRATNTAASGVAVSNPFGSSGTLTNDGLIAETASSGIGVRLSGGGVVTNASGGTITADTGVYSGGNNVTLINAGALSGNSTSGYAVRFLDGGVVSNQSGGSITGLAGIYIGTAAGTVSNSGVIIGIVGTSSSSYGIVLRDGGSISNASGGTISGVQAIVANSGTTTVVNAGSIGGISESGSYDGRGVYLFAGGSVTNETGGVISGFHAVQARGTTVTVVNAGTISGGATGASRGVALLAGDSLTNQSGGTITGEDAVYVAVAGTNAVAAAVTNAGVIGDTTHRFGVYMRHQGVVTNQAGGVIRGAWFGVDLRQGGTLLNAGSIAGGASAFDAGAGYTARLIVDPGAVFTGKVDGGNSIGASSVSTLELASAASTGTFTSLGSQFVNFAQVTVDSGATWALSGSNTIVAGVTLTNSGSLTDSGTLANAGTFTGNALRLDNGSFTNQAGGLVTASYVYGVTGGTGGVLNQGTMIDSAGGAISLAGTGNVTNTAGALIDSKYGVTLNGIDATLVNQGGITATDTAAPSSFGVYLRNGGLVMNGQATGSTASTAAISGYSAVVIYSTDTANAIGTVDNYGTIRTAQRDGLFIKTAGEVSNGLSGASGALIQAGYMGAYVQSGSVTNAGSIIASRTGTAYGVFIADSGTVSNLGSASLIEGYTALHVGLNSTVVNQGTIATNRASNGVALWFTGGNARLVEAPSATLIGSVYVAAGGTNTAVLELASGASAGTISGIGNSITNFSSLVFDTGAHWTVSGNDSADGLGTLGISGFTYGDTIDITNFAASSSRFSSNKLTLTSGASSITLNIAGAFGASQFALASDGAVGTDITLGPAVVTYDWTGASGDWQTATNWSSDVVPGTSANATIANTGSNTVTIGSTETVSVAGLTLSNGDTLLVDGTFASAPGIDVSGATVSVGSTGTVSGTFGVLGATSGTATVVNAGHVTASATGVKLQGGGAVSNQSSGVISGYYGVWATNAAAAIVNAGSILGTTTANSGIGIYLSQGGTVTNQSGGVIGGTYGVFVGAGAVTVVNAGSIGGRPTASASGTLTVAADGIHAKDGGTVTNLSGGTISGFGGVIALGAAATVLNSGVVAAGTTTFVNATARATVYSAGIYLGAGGAVSNQSSGTISGYDGIWVTGGAAGLVNAGTILGGAAAGVGVGLMQGGTLTNQSGGTITAQYALIARTIAATVINAGYIGGGATASGTLKPAGVYLGAGGSIANQSGGTISGDVGVVGGTGGAVSMVNAGLITAAGTGSTAAAVYITHGGAVTNQSGGLISGHYGIHDIGAPLTVTNAGSIQGGVSSGSAAGIMLGAGGTVSNSGTITGGAGIVVSGTSAALVIDSGAIIGTAGTAVAMGPGNDTVQFQPSSSAFVQGTVDGGGGTNTLAFLSGASAGTLTGSNADFVNFTGGSVASGATWVLAGSETFGSGLTLTNSGSLSATGTLSNAGTIDGNPLTLSGASFTNLSGGLVTGTAYGVLASGASTLVNDGSLAANTVSGEAASFANGGVVSNRVRRQHHRQYRNFVQWRGGNGLQQRCDHGRSRHHRQHQRELRHFAGPRWLRQQCLDWHDQRQPRC